jgi:hypothetical protein
MFYTSKFVSILCSYPTNARTVLLTTACIGGAKSSAFPHPYTVAVTSRRKSQYRTYRPIDGVDVLHEVWATSVEAFQN